MARAAYWTACRWQDVNTGSAWIAASQRVSPTFEQGWASVQALNASQDTNAWFVGQWDDVAQNWVQVSPIEGVDRCECGAKYWDGLTCHSCGEQFKAAA